MIFEGKYFSGLERSAAVKKALEGGANPRSRNVIC
jgi:hypothetical protein